MGEDGSRQLEFPVETGDNFFFGPGWEFKPII